MLLMGNVLKKYQGSYEQNYNKNTKLRILSKLTAQTQKVVIYNVYNTLLYITNNR